MSQDHNPYRQSRQSRQTNPTSKRLSSLSTLSTGVEPQAIRRAINRKARRLAAIEEVRLREAITAAVQAARKAGATGRELVDLVHGWA